MRVLIIDKDQSIADGLSFVLKGAGYTSDHASTGEEGIALCKLYDYDVVIVDIVLTDIKGVEILHRLRKNGVKTPLVVVSSSNEAATKIEALNLGADDYVVKPFHAQELLARLKAIIRRSSGHSTSTITFGRLVVDLRRNLAEVNGIILSLTSKEYSILELLALRKGGVISKGMFLNHLYGGMDEPEIKILDVFICRLRKKIAAVTGGDNFIQTIWGRGYILQDPAETLENKKEVRKAG